MTTDTDAVFACCGGGCSFVVGEEKEMPIIPMVNEFKEDDDH
jgi:hypothetical protein